MPVATGSSDIGSPSAYSRRERVIDAARERRQSETLFHSDVGGTALRTQLGARPDPRFSADVEVVAETIRPRSYARGNQAR